MEIVITQRVLVLLRAMSAAEYRRLLADLYDGKHVLVINEETGKYEVREIQ